jgi:hypothetical protein
MRVMWATFGLIACLGCDLAAPIQASQLQVDVELVLAVDASRSMDDEEFALQRAGYVAALRDPAFLRVVRSGMHGRIAITYFEWAGAVRPESVVAWQVIEDAADVEAFADALALRPAGGFRGTSISAALDHAAALFPDNGFAGTRRVIDISGDGPNNQGGPVTAARDAAVVEGIIVNGLPILVRPSPTFPQLDRYYAECVIGGPGSFMLPIRSPGEFATAIRRKLILEVSGAPAPAIVKVAAEVPVDCLKGERDRRLFADPHFPELDR